jgi:hypothetical protein
MIKKVAAALALIIIIAIAGFFGMYKYENRRLSPDYFQYYKNQNTAPEGKVGVFVTGLIIPETPDPVFFYNIPQKIAKNIIPWPFRIFAGMDKGIALFDPERYCEFAEFTPGQLVNAEGGDRDIDGEPYIEKYKRGEVKWEPPAKMLHKDTGYFVYTKRKCGMPSLAGKMIGKARLWYYDRGIVQKKIPHWQGTFDIINKAMAGIEKSHPDIMWRAEGGMYYYDMQHKLYEMLDAGCTTIVLAAPMAVYSHFEEFDSSFRHSSEYIEEWEKAHPGKKIKIIMAPPMGKFKPLREAYLAMLKDRLDTLPKGASVAVAAAVHGLPWDQRSWEAWIELAPEYRDPLLGEIQTLLSTYGFSKTTVMGCQDEFADPVRDPKDTYLSTNEAYWKAIKEGYDYVVGLPIEFFAENTDTLYYHAIKNYDGFSGYNVYEPVNYPDWSVPYTREFVQGKTHIIYNGVPVGKYQHFVVDALCAAVDSVLKHGSTN